jgi:long-subunit acyl-CoA synthetase (AMP-forming)
VAFAAETREPVAQLALRYSINLLAVDPALSAPGSCDEEYVVDINADSIPEGKRPRGGNSRALPGAHSLAFGSGTTGRPKGLIISTAGTEHLIDLFAAAFGIQSGDRFLTFLPFSNYQQRMTYYFCLQHGVDFVYSPHSHLFVSLREHKPTFTIAPPLFYESVHNVALSLSGGKADSQTASRLQAMLGGNIRFLVTGMAPIKRRTLDFFWNGSVPLYEAFGITEAGMVAWNKPGGVKVGTVGRPAETGTVSLSDEGEVVITRASLLSLGYFDAPEEDARATFVGSNSVATGDIARFDDEGFLVITGRKKDAIVARSGEKFHPEPIEALLQGHTAVKTAVVASCCDDGPGTTAILVVAQIDQDSTDPIRHHIDAINAQLPAYQQVRNVIFTQREFNTENGLRTANLKLNRNAIRTEFLQS